MLPRIAVVVSFMLLWAGVATAQSFFPPTLGTTGVACSPNLPGMAVTVSINGVAPAYYLASGAVLTRNGDRLRLTYLDGCGLLTVITHWSLTATLQGVPPGTYAIDVVANPDGHTCAFAPLGPAQIGTIVVPPLPCPAPCLADVAAVGGNPGRDGLLTADDVVVYLSAFFAGNLSVADVAMVGGGVGADGQLTPDDIVLFLDRFFGGCP